MYFFLSIRPSILILCVSGFQKSTKEKDRSLFSSLLPALIGVMAGMLSFLSFIRKRILGDDESQRSDDQRQVLAYVCGIYGLTEEVDRYLLQVPKASY